MLLQDNIRITIASNTKKDDRQPVFTLKVHAYEPVWQLV